MAETAISRALSLDNQLAETYASLGLLRHQTGDLNAAEQAYRHAIELNPGYTMAHMWMGNLLLDSGRLQESLRTYGRAKSTDPFHPVISANYAAALFTAGRYEEGMKILRDAARVSPESDTLKRQMAAWSGKYGRVDEAMAYAREAVVIDPRAPNNLLMMSVAAQGLGEMQTAEIWQKRAESVAPDNYMVILRRAELLLQSGRIVALDDYAETRLRSYPVSKAGPLTEADRMHLTWAGIAKIHLHDYDQGVAYLERATVDSELPRDRFRIHAMANLAIAYGKSARDKEAKAILDQCRAIVEDMRRQGIDDPGLRVLIAGLFAIEGKTSDAIDLLESAAVQGWKNYRSIENGIEFDNLRRDARFRALMQRLRTEVSVLRGKEHMAVERRNLVDGREFTTVSHANSSSTTQTLARRQNMLTTNMEVQ
jgi:tetratricopeptide (TPR) repeat protein